MDQLPPSMRRALASGGGPAAWVQRTTMALLEAFLALMALFLMGTAVLMSIPGLPFAKRLHDWFWEFVGNMLTNLVPISIAGGVVAALLAALVWQHGHHDHGKRIAYGAGIGIAIGVAAILALSVWPHLKTGSLS